MRDETAEPRDSNHIWLRQSVTFTVNGQTRTVEMALPLRTGATPGEVEALLDEADAGMRRLSRRLDAHLAELNTPSAANAPATRPNATPAASAGRPATRPQERTDARPAAQRPALPPVQRPTAAIPPTSAGPDLTIPEFIAQATAIGYDSRQAMDKLGVHSLTGLNLREALEALRRQALLEGTAPAAPSQPAAPPLAFEEEEDSAAFAGEPEMELSYPDPASLPDGEDEDSFFAEEANAGQAPTSTASNPSTAAPAPSPTSGPLADVPDLGALRRDARLTPASKLPAPTPRRATPPTGNGKIAETPAAPPVPAPTAEETPAARAERIIAELRTAHPGGAPSADRRSAFKHAVIDQLTQKGVEGLTVGIWNLPSAQLGPEQTEALISWSKRDEFVEEARAVYKLIQATAKDTQPPASEAPTPPPAPPARGDKPAARPRPAPPARERPGDN